MRKTTSPTATCLLTLIFASLITSRNIAADEAAADDSPPVVESVHLRGPVWMLRSNTPIGNPSTIASIGPDGAFVVDPNFAAVGEALVAEIRRLGGEKVRLVASTHHHGDHSEGFETFLPEALGLVPARQRERLATGAIVLGQRPIAEESLPQLTFEHEIALHWNGERVRIFPPPERSGHTDGDAIVYFEGSRVLCVGDLLFLHRFPIVDLDAGGSIDGYLADQEALLASFPADTLVVPGHGTFPPEAPRAATLEELGQDLRALRRSVELIRGWVEDGISVEQMLERPFPAKVAAFGEKPRYVSLEKWIRLVARDAVLRDETER